MIFSRSGLFGTSGSISVSLSRVLNAGVSTPMGEMTTGMSVHNSVVEGTAREKNWYDLMPSSKVA
jgi:hypothetical protein